MSVRSVAFAASIAVCFVISAGCGNSLQPLQPGGGHGDLGHPDAGVGVGGDGGSDGGPMAVLDMFGFNTPGSPLVVINSPTAGAEVQYDTLTVTATVTSPTSTLIA